MWKHTVNPNAIPEPISFEYAETNRAALSTTVGCTVRLGAGSIQLNSSLHVKPQGECGSASGAERKQDAEERVWSATDGGFPRKLTSLFQHAWPFGAKVALPTQQRMCTAWVETKRPTMLHRNIKLPREISDC